jgi:DNA modification methylase
MKTFVARPPQRKNRAVNSLRPEDEPVHGWYRFVLSYPPHLVRQYATKFELGKKDLLLDPFCGTGTTLVEAKKNSIPSVGMDAHPFAALVSRVKTNWDLDPVALRNRLLRLSAGIEAVSKECGLESLSFEAKLLQEDPRNPVNGNSLLLSEDEERLLPAGFLSSRPLQRLLVVRDEIEQQTAKESAEVREFFFVALAHTIANGAGNFAFGPEIYRTKPKVDYDVLGHFAHQGDRMINELTSLQRLKGPTAFSRVLQADARSVPELPEKVAAVITSPPYPNEKDYTRTTRVESILLRLVTHKAGLRQTKEHLLRSNTRNIFVNDSDADEVKEFRSITNISQEIENRRLELGKTSGFERLYPKVVGHYFGGMRRHFRTLRPWLKPRGRLAFVVGDQFSFLMIPIPTAKLLGEVAESEGYRVVGCDLWRERIGTKVRNDANGRTTIRVREEVLLLEKDE